MPENCSATREPLGIARATLPTELDPTRMTMHWLLGLPASPTSPLDEPFFEREPRHVSAGQDRRRFESLFALSRLDALLERGASVHETSEAKPMKNHHDLTLLKRVWRDGAYWTGKWGTENQTVSLGVLKAGFNAGYTLLLRSLEKRELAVASLCGGIEAHTLIPCNANAYLTPSGAQGFDAHYDWMDAIVLQLDGAKSWRLWPHIHHRLPNKRTKRKPTKEELAALPAPIEVRLEMGDALYLPRGIVHEAVTPTHSPQSLHLTIGLLIEREHHSWESLIHEAIECDAAGGGAQSEMARDEARDEAAEGSRALDADARAVLHAALRAVASSEEASATQLRQALPLHRGRASIQHDPAFRASILAAARDALSTPLVSAAASLALACQWSEATRRAGRSDATGRSGASGAAGGGEATVGSGEATEQVEPFTLPARRCSAGAPSPRSLVSWEAHAPRLLGTRCLAAAAGRVERRARALLDANRHVRTRCLSWHGHQ